LRVEGVWGQHTVHIDQQLQEVDEREGHLYRVELGRKPWIVIQIEFLGRGGGEEEEDKEEEESTPNPQPPNP
jgi:hypothetical protein